MKIRPNYMVINAEIVILDFEVFPELLEHKTVYAYSCT